MFAMAGAGQRHNLNVMNLSGTLHQQFLARSCVVYPPDLRVRTKNRAYCYPDVTAVCGESRFDDDHLDTLLNPVLLIEVISPSTEAYDRGLKFEQYRSIETLREYLLVASDRTRVDLYTRQDDGRWVLTPLQSLEDKLWLESVQVEVSLATIYAKVMLPETA